MFAHGVGNGAKSAICVVAECGALPGRIGYSGQFAAGVDKGDAVAISVGKGSDPTGGIEVSDQAVLLGDGVAVVAVF